MFFKTLVLMFFSSQVFAQGVPIERDGPRGWTLGLQKQVAIGKLDASPIGLSSADLEPPLITLKGAYQPNYNAIFQPDVKLALSSINGAGIYAYLQGGGWFDFRKFHLFFGGEYFGTLSGGDYGGTALDHTGIGGYIKGAMPLGRFYPSFEIRWRKIREAEIANREELTTYIEHDTDVIIRPSLNFDLEFIQLWGALTSYKPGNTAIASDGFGVGIKGDPFYIYSAGVGFTAFDMNFWVKAHHIANIKDETAHFYQVPQIYPDFLIAKQSASVEILWHF